MIFFFYKCLLESFGCCSSVLTVIMLISDNWVVTVKILVRNLYGVLSHIHIRRYLGNC